MYFGPQVVADLLEAQAFGNQTSRAGMTQGVRTTACSRIPSASNLRLTTL